MSQLTGSLAFNLASGKFSVGIYQTTLGTVSASSNYVIGDFESGLVEIVAKN